MFIHYYYFAAKLEDVLEFSFLKIFEFYKGRYFLPLLNANYGSLPSLHDHKDFTSTDANQILQMSMPVYLGLTGLTWLSEAPKIPR